MSTFADPSALVELYADEPGHELVRAEAGLIVSQLARVEVPAPPWRKVRTGELAPDDAGVLVADFEADHHGTGDELPRFAAVAVDAALLDVAAQLAVIHSLRAHDAVQLASARLAATADPSCETFAVFDVQLRAAAAAERFRLLHPALLTWPTSVPAEHDETHPPPGASRRPGGPPPSRCCTSSGPSGARSGWPARRVCDWRPSVLAGS